MNTNALAVIQPDELDTIQRTGRLLAASGYFDAKGESAQAIAMMATKILAGREMGFGPFASVNGIHIINGKPSIGAGLMATAVKASGRYTYKVRELTAKVCRLEFFEREGDKWVSAGVSEYTIEEAPAELKKKDVWMKYPKNMLFARALSNGVRWFAPDVFSGTTVYVPDELVADVDGDGNVIRIVDGTTGELLEPAKYVDVGFEKPVKIKNKPTDTTVEPNVESDASVFVESDSSTPVYAHLIDSLTGDCLERANRARNFHAQGKGPASPAQYQYLSGVIDDLVGVQKAHNAILEVFVGRAVNGENPPSILLASKLLDALVAYKSEEVDGEKVSTPDPSYSIAAVNCVHTVWRLVQEANGQQSLFEQAASAQEAQAA